MNQSKIFRILRTVCYHCLLNVILFFAFTLIFAICEFDEITIEKIIFHFLHPIDGVESGIMIKFIVYSFSPVLLFNYIYLILNSRKRRYALYAINILWLFVIYLYISIELNLIGYIKNDSNFSRFIEKNYIDPNKVDIIFEKKKNLICIYLESIENSFSDKRNGGVFDINMIPNLTKLAHTSTDFSGSTGKLNGSYSLPGTNWTMGALFALNTGLPLKINLNKHEMNTQDSFFPNIVSLGDILHKNGYTQKILLGSNGNFAGRKKFFEEHGNYEVIDFAYMKKNKLIPENYRVFWGVEDYKLFEIAKEELKKLSNDSKPFNLSLLTVDTHQPDGYLSKLCENKFNNEKYKNVIYCSDNQIFNFIQWLQKQDFYKDTIIVLVGDHPTNKRFFISMDSKEYIRKNYTTYINTQHLNNKLRSFSHFDNFPTILSAIGAKIPGERLGLGTNLFSEEDTLLEKFSYEFVKNELNKRSLFSENMLKVTFPLAKLKNILQLHGAVFYTNKFIDDNISINLDIQNLIWKNLNKNVDKDVFIYNPNDIDYIYATIYTDKKMHKKQLIPFIKINDYLFNCKFKINKNSLYHMEIRIKRKKYNGKTFNVILGYMIGDLSIQTNNIKEYFELLNNKKYTIFISSCGKIEDSLMKSVRDNFQRSLLFNSVNEHMNNFVAILDSEKNIEQSSMSKLEFNNHFVNDMNTKYFIVSNSSELTNYSSIVIQGKEYSKNKLGLNFVVYDNHLHQVVDSMVLNEYNGKLTIIR